MHSINHKNRIHCSPSSIKDRIPTQCLLPQPHVAKLMRQADIHIHLSCDGWTCPHQTMVILGIIAYFLSKTGTRMDFVIGLRLLEGSHTCANMAEVVTGVLREYGVEEKLGYFVGDNASNNDTLVMALAEDQVFRNGYYDAGNHRLRRAVHDVNLEV